MMRLNKTSKWFIFAIALLTLIFACANYPLFSKGFSFAVVFGSFVVMIFSGASILYPTDKNSYDKFEKEQEEKYNDEGIFTYNEDGFSFQQKGLLEEVKWKDITKISSITVRVFKETQSGILIETEEKKYEFLDQFVPGIENLLNEAEQHLPLKNADEVSEKTNTQAETTIVLYSRNDAIQ